MVRSHFKAAAAAAALVAAIGSVSSVSLAAGTYDIQPLDSNGASDVYAKGINNAGQVVGYLIDQDGGSHATLWDATGAHELRYISDNQSSQAYRINNSGQIVGKSTAADGNSHATLWSAATGDATDIGTLEGGHYSFANDISDNGIITGSSGASLGSHAFTWTSGGGFVDYGNALPGSQLGQAGGNGVNNAGTIVGTSYVIMSPYKAAMAHPGDTGMTNISPAGQFSTGMAMAINNAGTVVGYQNSPGESPHAAIFHGDGTFDDLGALGLSDSQAFDVNELGQIVGTAFGADPDGNFLQEAFVYDGGVMTDLLTILNNNADGGWTQLFSADAINDNGMIVGAGVYNGEIRGYVLTPVPEPASIAVFALTSGFLTTRRRRAR